MNTRFVLYLAIVLLLAVPFANTAAQEWFQSNSLGQPLKPITTLEASGLEWSLRIDRENNWEISRLYQSGKEKRRWERLKEEDKLTEELFFDRGVAREHNFYDAYGRLTEEWVFGPAGQLEEKIRYNYPEDPQITLWTSREILAADGTPTSSDKFSYRADGSLKSIRKTETSGKVYYQVFRYTGGGSVKEVADTRNGALRSVRYDESGRLSVEEFYSSAGKTLLRVNYFYGDTGKMVRRREENFETTTLVITDYDPMGLPMAESWYRNNFLSESKYWEYDEQGRVSRELSMGSGGRFERRLTYEGNESTPDTEVYYSGGGLIRRVLHPEPGLVEEERYHNGELILKTWIRDGIREKEEHYRDGQKIR